MLSTALLAGDSRAQTAPTGDFAIEPGATCVTSSCHETITDKEYVHTAASDGEMCAFCHETPEEDRHRFELAGEGGELCFQCHDSEVFEDATVHGPVGRGQCLKCHNPHASDNSGQTRAPLPDLCFGCHNRAQKDHKGRILPPPKRTFENAELNLHAPFEAGECTWCHMPHASPNYRLLVGPYPEGLYENFSPEKFVCFDCHDSDAFAEPRTFDATEFRNGNLNLHHRLVNRKKGRVCKACHDHHGAPNPKLIRDRVPFGDRFIDLTYEKTETGGSCAVTCHMKVSYDRWTPAINAIRVTPREGEDATPEELERAKNEQLGE